MLHIDNPLMPREIKDPRSRSYVFTLNNYTAEDIGDLESLFADGLASYICWGKEVGASGTPHLQGFVQWRDGRTITSSAALLNRAHCEKRAGTILQAIEYCKKDGDWTEHGEENLSLIRLFSHLN